MKVKNLYVTSFKRGRLTFALWALVSCLFILLPQCTLGQVATEYDEISIYFNVKGIDGAEIPAAIYEQQAYLSLTDVFDFLKIKNIPTPRLDSVEGFIIKEEATYIVDAKNYQIQYQDKRFDLKPTDLIRTADNLYLKLDYFGKVFGLDCKFNFRSLSVKMKTELDLPLIRLLRMEAMRKNRDGLKGEISPDTIIKRDYPLFKLGMADWSIAANQDLQGMSSENLHLALGSMIAGGETNLRLNYTPNSNFSLNKQYYQWHFVNNKLKLMRQVRAGKISRQSISSITASVVGVQLTNTPTTQRRSFGSYTLSDFTEPNWIVELYVNNRMIDYAKADASGFYSFNVPLMYGNTELRLRFYGPWGEERTKEETISIPLNFLPQNEFQYSLQAGVLQDGEQSRFTRAKFNYGVSRSITFGGGMEYLSSPNSAESIPFANFSLRIASGLLFLGEYNHGVSSVGRLSYQGVSNLNLVVDYTRYVKDQIAINTNTLEERKLSLSLPIRTPNFSAYSRLALNQMIYPSGKSTRAEIMFSGSIFGANTNLKTNAMFSNGSQVNVSSNLSMAFGLPSACTFSPRLQYNYSQNELVFVSATLQKKVFKKAYLDISYNYNLTSETSTAQIGLRYDFSFGSASVSARRSNNKISFSQSARGSLMYDRSTKYLGTSNRNTVGKGGIIFLPFLDYNCNGHHDKGEPKTWGLKLKIKGCSRVNMDRDTIIRVVNMEPYRNYTVQIDPNSFNNIGWKIEKKILSIEVIPNYFKRVEIPVSVVGEVAGTVYHRDGEKQNGIGRIIVNFYNSDSIRIARTLTEVDGYFSYLGLPVGSYTVRVDSAQLQKLNLIAMPDILPFTIKRKVDGDYVDGLELVLQNPVRDTSISIVTAEEEEMLVKNTDRDACLVQVGEFELKAHAVAVQKQLQESLGYSAVIVFEGDIYKLIIAGVESRKKADLLVPKLVAMGYSDVFTVFVEEYRKINNIELITRGVFAVQLGAFLKQSNALALQYRLAGISDKTVVIEYEEGLYKVRFNYFYGRKEAKNFILKLLDQGFSELIIVPVFRKLSF
ncbi:SPOR domain-containing protein [Labilibaculum sp. K2S]|uniref:SPOR domain-containing protein n=1 Tax=Labilibaculum sp. K2S TaxID=3056386 RepID=UPI0025A4AC49|nr:SPOR domain-containing protein [Labilibaculum sp. K2S]MDM8161064.1 SPOR domain-containing protein [Labilibaculum sp. K2S]